MTTTVVRASRLIDQVGHRVRAIASSDRTWNFCAVAIAVYGDCGLPLLSLARGELATDHLRFGLPIAVVLVLNGLVAQLLWLRLRRPVGVFALLLTYAVFVLLLTADDASWAALMVSLYTVASRRSLRAGVAAGSLVAIYILGSAFAMEGPSDARFRLGLLFNAVAFPGSMTLLGRLTQALRLRGVELRHRQLRREEIIRTERERLARELHDTVAHSLSGIMMLAVGSRTAADVDHRQSLRSIEIAGAQALRELSRMLGVLRATGGTSTDADMAQATLDDLDVLIDRTRACGVSVELTVIGEPGPLDPSVDHAAYRTVQECLANVIKHGGADSIAQVLLRWTDDTVVIEVSNAVGRHDHAIPSGFGLRGIRERVDLVGGRFSTERLDTAHFRVRVELPRSG